MVLKYILGISVIESVLYKINCVFSMINTFYLNPVKIEKNMKYQYLLPR